MRNLILLLSAFMFASTEVVAEITECKNVELKVLSETMQSIIHEALSKEGMMTRYQTLSTEYQLCATKIYEASLKDKILDTKEKNIAANYKIIFNK